MDKATPLKLKVEALKELTQYYHPKRRAIEVSGEQTVNIKEKQDKIKELDDLIEDAKKQKIAEISKTVN